MSIKFGAVILGAASLLFACETKADFLEFKLDTSFNGTPPSSTAPWLTATFSQGLNGTVNLALQSSLHISSEFFGSLGFNFNSAKNLTGVSQNGGSFAGVTSSQNGENLEGGGDLGKDFDVMIHFETANAGRFQGTDLITFTFSSLTDSLTLADFDLVNPSGLYLAAHVQGIGDSQSGAITGARTGEADVPDSGSTLILLGIGTTLFAFVRRASIN
jgi:hypothetical protein